MKVLLAIGFGLSSAATLVACGSADAEDVSAGAPTSVDTAVPVAVVEPSAAPTVAQVAWPEGLYGNVRSGAESGDLGGFEIRFYERNSVHMAEFVLCEGWCNASYHSQVRQDSDGFVVEALEPLFGEGPTEYRNMRFRLTPVEGGLHLEGWYDGQAMDFWGKGAPLPRIEYPFGLDVANHATE